MRRFAMRKLVRDNVPAELRQKGLSPETSMLTPELAEVWLKAKLAEETDEVGRATSREAVKAELADVLEVARALAKAYGVTEAEVELARRDKLVAKGGFTDLCFISHVDVPDDSGEVAYFKARADEFPELPVKEGAL
jgi:predicted house-cleaning noncanonical NTP pyrophosphatase (MazG superfamily)